MANLSLEIHRHTQALEGLRAEVDGLYEAVEIQTAEAREKLLTYRKLKMRTESALDKAAAEYERARSLFGQAEALFEKLREIKDEHVRLSALAVKQADPESIVKLQAARRQGKELYSEIEKLLADALPAELAETPSPG